MRSPAIEQISQRSREPRRRTRAALKRYRRTLLEAFAKYSSSPEPLSISDSAGEACDADFFCAVAPLARLAAARLSERLAVLAAKAPTRFDQKALEACCFDGLRCALLDRITRTLILEMRVAALQGSLRGSTPEERFRDFAHRLRGRRAALRILRDYPILAQQLVICAENWISCAVEAVNHFCEDSDAIRATFSPDRELGVLTSLRGGMGDSHRGGRSVLIAGFDSGLRLVYKPRSLAVDVHFQELLEWLNERGEHPPFRTLSVLDRQDHGWIEFVSAEPCASRAALQRFYERQGGYLALLYALRARDFHFENVIAAGEHPVMIDLETLFHPPFDRTGVEAQDPAADALDDSALQVGLLPVKQWTNETSAGIDVSGISGAGGQLSPNAAPVVQRAGTDEMRIGRERIEIPSARNRPTWNGAEIDPLQFQSDVAAGFASVYRLIAANRGALLVPTGPLARFAQDQVRTIFLPTQTYGLILLDAFHPDFLRNGSQRDRLFEPVRAAAGHIRGFERLVPSQIQDLKAGDVPLFTTRPDSLSVWTSGGEAFDSFFPQAGLDAVYARISAMDAAGLDSQLWLIRASFAASVRDPRRAQPVHTPRPASTVESSDAGLIAAADDVAQRLERLAFVNAGEANWIGLTLQGARSWALAPLGLNLYDGLPGVILFLAYLGSTTGRQSHTALAEKAMRTLRRRLRFEGGALRSIGAFQGWGGLVYTLAHLGSLWADESLLAEAATYAADLGPLIEADEQFDIIGGSAGCLAALAALHNVMPAPALRALVEKCGVRLISGAIRQQDGIAWMTPAAGSVPLGGFSHGVSGIAWALLKAAEITGQDRFYRAASDAIRYERSLYDAAAGNWLDLREDTTQPGGRPVARQREYGMAWCHGAPGIGMARAAALTRWNDSETRSEIAAAVDATLAHGFNKSHSLCHGSLGNLDLLLEAARALGSPALNRRAALLAARAARQIQRTGPVCGTPCSLDVPGLMTGLAGIGYGLLRAHQPGRTPSILLLQPPIASSAGMPPFGAAAAPGAEQLVGGAV